MVNDLLHQLEFERVAGLAALRFDRGERRPEGGQTYPSNRPAAGEGSETFPMRLEMKAATNAAAADPTIRPGAAK